MVDKNFRSEEIFSAKNWGFRAKAGTGLAIASRNWQGFSYCCFPLSSLRAASCWSYTWFAKGNFVQYAAQIQTKFSILSNDTMNKISLVR